MAKEISQWQIGNIKSRSFLFEDASQNNKDFLRLLRSITDWWQIIQDDNKEDEVYMIYSIDFTYDGADDTETATVYYTTR